MQNKVSSPVHGPPISYPQTLSRQKPVSDGGAAKFEDADSKRNERKIESPKCSRTTNDSIARQTTPPRRTANKPHSPPLRHASDRPRKKLRKVRPTRTDMPSADGVGSSVATLPEKKSSQNKECDQMIQHMALSAPISNSFRARMHRGGGECSVCKEPMSHDSACAPALLRCGHVATCLTCYHIWNNGKLLQTCPLCQETQTIPPLRVDLDFSCNESRFMLDFKVDVTYLARVNNQRTALTISCKLASTGEDIKKSALIECIKKNINFPEEFQSPSFRTQNQTFILHGNTTLYDIGFQATSHTLFIQENALPFEHKIVQKRLHAMKNSPNTRFKLRLRAANGSGLSDIMMTVEKDYTIDYLVQRIIQYFVKIEQQKTNPSKKFGKYTKNGKTMFRKKPVASKVTSIQGKKIVIHLPSLGVLVDTKLTFKQLKINTTSYLVFEFFD